ncbi:MAG TPA: DegT/DnrJ/EryC1/StrS aminotransferase family protein [Burkholderiales bacterium]|nr:DegT/DnrJ/EryC1/StrS aminotransferase family protein [Burkholderiales bacterium]
MQAWPLMRNNIVREDLDSLIEYLKGTDPMLTQSGNVRAFEKEWSEWLGVKHSVFVNSGSSANLITMAALRELRGGGQVIVPTLTWVSDIASVLQCGFDPVFVDIDERTLGMDVDAVLKKITKKTRAVFLTHILGYNAINDRLLRGLKKAGVPLIEDVCESHGATHKGRKLGTFGLVSNFSFYYAHHMSTVEGGVACTDDAEFYEALRMLRSHGMVREATAADLKARYREQYPDLNPEFIFAFPAYNVRSTELNAVLGRTQLKRLDENNERRTANLKCFLGGLDPKKYRTDFAVEGSCNYAFTLVLKKPDDKLMAAVEKTLHDAKVEFRRGTSGGGNQLRQPYLRKIVGKDAWKKFPKVDHVHFYGMYIGNYPDLEHGRIRELCKLLNGVQA